MNLNLARGDAFFGEALPIPSPLPKISDVAWTRFVGALATQDLAAVSASNGLGKFEMRPKRLGDLGIVEGLRAVRSPSSGRMIWVCRFSSDAKTIIPEHRRCRWVRFMPLTAAKFLRSLEIQYAALDDSVVDYAERIASGEIVLPDDASLSGGLALLHRSGLGGLRGARFENTCRVFDRANDIF